MPAGSLGYTGSVSGGAEEPCHSQTNERSRHFTFGKYADVAVNDYRQDCNKRFEACHLSERIAESQMTLPNPNRSKREGRDQFHRGEEHAFTFFPTDQGGLPKPALRIIQEAGLGLVSAPLGSRRPARNPATNPVTARFFSNSMCLQDEVDSRKRKNLTLTLTLTLIGGG